MGRGRNLFGEQSQLLILKCVKRGRLYDSRTVRRMARLGQ
jgi:hypothetical protein